MDGPGWCVDGGRPWSVRLFFREGLMGRGRWRYVRHEEERAKKKRMHPAWRGVGCFLLVLLTLGGYLFSDWFLRANAVGGWVYLPAGLLRPPFAPWLPAGLLFKVVVAFLFLILSYAVLTTVYAIAFPIRLGETDAPPLKRQGPRRR
jgi:hypothetical protein